MTRKQKKQLELRYTIHRCKACGRELKNQGSILRGMGTKCYRKHQISLEGLRGLAARENG
jgi:hypothetical protein